MSTSDADRPSWAPQASSDPPETPAPAGMSAFTRLLQAFVAPGAVFADIGRKPTWVVVLVALVVLGVAVQMIVLPHVDNVASVRQSLGSRADDMSDEQIDAMVEQGQKFARFAPVIGIVVGPIAWLIMGALFFLLLKLVGSEIDFPRAFSTTLHAYWPPAVTVSVLTAVLIQRLGTIPQQELGNVVKANLGAFLPESVPAWIEGAASVVSVFNVWTVVLLVIGFETVGRLSRGKALAVSLIPWLAWMAGKAGLSALMG